MFVGFQWCSVWGLIESKRFGDRLQSLEPYCCIFIWMGLQLQSTADMIDIMASMIPQFNQQHWDKNMSTIKDIQDETASQDRRLTRGHSKWSHDFQQPISTQNEKSKDRNAWGWMEGLNWVSGIQQKNNTVFLYSSHFATCSNENCRTCAHRETVTWQLLVGLLQRATNYTLQAGGSTCSLEGGGVVEHPASAWCDGGEQNRSPGFWPVWCKLNSRLQYSTTPLLKPSKF